MKAQFYILSTIWIIFALSYIFSSITPNKETAELNKYENLLQNIKTLKLYIKTLKFAYLKKYYNLGDQLIKFKINNPYKSFYKLYCFNISHFDYSCFYEKNQLQEFEDKVCGVFEIMHGNNEFDIVCDTNRNPFFYKYKKKYYLDETNNEIYIEFPLYTITINKTNGGDITLFEKKSNKSFKFYSIKQNISVYYVKKQIGPQFIYLELYTTEYNETQFTYYIKLMPQYIDLNLIISAQNFTTQILEGDINANVSKEWIDIFLGNSTLSILFNSSLNVSYNDTAINFTFFNPPSNLNLNYIFYFYDKNESFGENLYNANNLSYYIETKDLLKEINDKIYALKSVLYKTYLEIKNISLIYNNTYFFFPKDEVLYPKGYSSRNLHYEYEPTEISIPLVCNQTFYIYNSGNKFNLTVYNISGTYNLYIYYPNGTSFSYSNPIYGPPGIYKLKVIGDCIFNISSSTFFYGLTDNIKIRNGWDGYFYIIIPKETKEIALTINASYGSNSIKIWDINGKQILTKSFTDNYYTILNFTSTKNEQMLLVKITNQESMNIYFSKNISFTSLPYYSPISIFPFRGAKNSYFEENDSLSLSKGAYGNDSFIYNNISFFGKNWLSFYNLSNFLVNNISFEGCGKQENLSSFFLVEDNNVSVGIYSEGKIYKFKAFIYSYLPLIHFKVKSDCPNLKINLPIKINGDSDLYYYLNHKRFNYTNGFFKKEYLRDGLIIQDEKGYLLIYCDNLNENALNISDTISLNLYYPQFSNCYLVFSPEINNLYEYLDSLNNYISNNINLKIKLFMRTEEMSYESEFII